MHNSVKLNTPMELIDIKPVNPLISKCQIKVCYVGEQPNRNKSIITREVACDLANSIPGSPIVGFYNDEKQDFEGHNRELEVKDGQFLFKDTTRPYGFVDLNAPVWFQRYSDDGVEHEYLCTEGFLWTGQYPEAKRILEHGNGQSMELDDNLIDADWSINNNGKPEFFIINEAIISKLCILGEDVEPCFEGASISKVQYSFDDNFRNELFALMEQMKNILQEGGTSVKTKKDAILEDVNANGAETVTDFAAEEAEANNPEVKEAVPAAEEIPAEDKPEDAPEAEEAEAEAEAEDVAEEAGEDANTDPKDEEKGAAAYNLDDVKEYAELTAQYSALEAEKNSLQTSLDALNEELNSLREFKLSAERKEKESMIKSFYMLSDEDKKDVIDNIDTYSLDEIEAKLSVICVRNKVNFDLETNKDEDNNNDVTTFNLNDDAEDASVPAWVKAVQSVAKNNK